MAKPVTFIDTGGVPVTRSDAFGSPVTPVAFGGQPCTLVPLGGRPVSFVDEHDGAFFAPENMGLALNFVDDLYFKDGLPVTLSDLGFTDTHPSDLKALNASGLNDTFAANEIVRNNLGAQVVSATTNLFLYSDTPATQTVAVVDAAQYTISVVGPGSITLSGSGTGVVTSDSPVTLTTAGTNLVCTVSGTLIYAQVQIGSFATPLVVTAGVPETAPGNLQKISGLTINDGINFSLIADIKSPHTNFRRLLELNDGTSSNKISLYTSNDRLYLNNAIGGVNNFTQIDDSWPQGLIGLTLTSSTGFTKISLSGGASVENTTLTLPVVDTLNFFGHGINDAENSFGRVKEYYHQTGAIYDTANHDEMHALTIARQEIYA